MNSILTRFRRYSRAGRILIDETMSAPRDASSDEIAARADTLAAEREANRAIEAERAEYAARFERKRIEREAERREARREAARIDARIEARRAILARAGVANPLEAARIDVRLADEGEAAAEREAERIALLIAAERDDEEGAKR